MMKNLIYILMFSPFCLMGQNRGIVSEHCRAYKLMPALVHEALEIGQDSIARIVALDYISHYLQTLPDDQLWTSDNIHFIDEQRSLISIGDLIFHKYFLNRVKIDSVMHDSYYSASLINHILYRDWVKPIIYKGLKSGVEPHWRKLKREISVKYDDHYAEINVLKAKIYYFKSKKKWESYIKCFIWKQELDNIENLRPSAFAQLILNNAAFEIFEYSTHKRELRKALFWSNLAIQMVSTPFPLAADMDTKANLLYKLGKRSEGLALEKQAYNLLPKDQAIITNYEKMKNGLPTW
jgi:hypothetical protein